MPPHLLLLPRELRDMIWIYTLTSTSLPPKSSGFTQRNSSLLAVNHQTRSETTALYFKLITFPPSDWHACTIFLLNLTWPVRSIIHLARQRLQARDSIDTEEARQTVIAQVAECLRINRVRFQWLVLKLALESPELKMIVERKTGTEKENGLEYVCRCRFVDSRMEVLSRRRRKLISFAA